MALIHDIQTSFSGGEIAPTVHGRVDIAKYKTALKTCRNAIPGPHGSVSNRPGTYFVGMSKFVNKKSRLIPFVFSQDDAYGLEFGDGYIRFFKDGGAVLEDAYDYTVPAWNAQTNYAVDDYVLATGDDGGGAYSIHLFKSIKYFNLGFTPLTSPTYWDDLGYLPLWEAGNVYNTGDYVSEIRTADGKSKTFISLIDSNTGLDPLNPEQPWTAITPNYDAGHTYALNDYVVVDIAGDHYRYKSLQNANTGHDPETETAWWDLDQPSLWNSGTTYAENEWCQYNGEWLGDYEAWDNGTVYALDDYVTVIDGTDQYLFKSNYDGNYANDPLDPQTWWSYSSLPWWAVGTTYALDDYVIRGVFESGKLNWYRYKSLQNANTGHDPVDLGAWWVLDQPTTWDDDVTYGIGDSVQLWSGGRWLIYESGLADNLNHNPANSGPAWTDMTPSSGYFRIYQSGINDNLNHNPANPYEGTAWQEVVTLGHYEVATDFTEAELPNIKYAQSADSLYLVHPNHKPVVLQRISDNEWTLSDYEFKNGPFMFPNTDPDEIMTLVLDTTYNLTSTSDYFQLSDGSDRLNELISLEIPIQGSVVTGDFNSNGSTTEILCGGSWRLMTTGTWEGTLTIQKSFDGGSTWETVDTWRSFDDGSGVGLLNVNTYGTIENDDEPFHMKVTMSGYSSGLCHATLTTDPFNQVIIGQITTILDATHAQLTITFPELLSLGSLLVAPQETPSWSSGSWSENNGWPGAVTFCQDRLVFAATESEPQTIWFTKSGNYVDFGRSDPLVDSDGITINLTSRELNKIKSLRSFLNSLLAFTESSEYSVGDNEGGPLTPTTITSRLQGLRGIGAPDPVMIGNRIIFDSPKGSSLRDMLFQVLTDSFESENISTISSHLLKGYSIVEMAYQQEPDSILWMVRDDGALLSLTYMREQEMLAWAEHDTDGLFESICTIPGDGLNEIWFVVNRDGRRFIERMTERVDSTDPEDQYFVDCGISYDGAAVSSLTGYDHLNEQTVAINADGFVLAQQVVVNGTIALPATGTKTTYSKVHIGLPFTSDIETLNPEIQLQQGPQFGRKYSINKVQFRFLNSRGGWIGQDEDSLTDEINQRDESLDTEEVTPLFTGYDSYTLPQGEDPWGHVMYRQVDPMPFTILGILSLIDIGENP